jgi:hypothetical protein
LNFTLPDFEVCSASKVDSSLTSQTDETNTGEKQILLIFTIILFLNISYGMFQLGNRTHGAQDNQQIRFA